MSAVEPTTEDQPPLRRRVARAAILLAGGAVFVAERDLARRPAGQVRGPKLVWRLGCSNALVALVYLRFGRVAADA